MYANRSNSHVIDRMIDVGEKKHRISIGQENDRNVVQLQKMQRRTHPREAKTSIRYHLDRINEERKVLKLRRSIQDYNSGFTMESWTIRANALRQKKTSIISRLVYTNRLLGRAPEVYFSDPDRCHGCDAVCTFMQWSSQNVCLSCGLVRFVLFSVDDSSKDVLVTKDPVSGMDVSPEGTSSQSTTREPGVSGCEYQYLRIPLYRKYLGQFEESVNIPMDVMRILYRYLSNIHLQNSIRCRPTPVGNILRQNGYSKWSNFSVRISKAFNGEPIPILSPELIDKLSERFGIIFKASIGTKHKLPCFEYLTHVLLLCERQPDLAQSFVLHKTPGTNRKSMEVVQELLKLANVPMEDWELCPTH
jgi:hypothetical protein